MFNIFIETVSHFFRDDETSVPYFFSHVKWHVVHGFYGSRRSSNVGSPCVLVRRVSGNY